MTHLVYTLDSSGSDVIYIDGVLETGTECGHFGPLSNWGDFELTLGNEPTGDRPWLGEMYLVAIFDRALTVEEVNQNFQAGPSVAPNSPTIVLQPANQTVTEPATGTFSVIAVGANPLSFQWQKSGCAHGGVCISAG